eukprot:gene3311-2293_t
MAAKLPTCLPAGIIDLLNIKQLTRTQLNKLRSLKLTPTQLYRQQRLILQNHSSATSTVIRNSSPVKATYNYSYISYITLGVTNYLVSIQKQNSPNNQHLNNLKCQQAETIITQSQIPESSGTRLHKVKTLIKYNTEYQVESLINNFKYATAHPLLKYHHTHNNQVTINPQQLIAAKQIKTRELLITQIQNYYTASQSSLTVKHHAGASPENVRPSNTHSNHHNTCKIYTHNAVANLQSATINVLNPRVGGILYTPANKKTTNYNTKH